MKPIRMMTGVAAVLVSLMPAAAFAETTLIYNSYLPPFDEMYKTAIAGFAASIEKESGGEIKVSIPDSTLAPSNRQYEMVRDGIADMAMVSTGGVPQLVALNKIADLPFNSPTARAASIALWQTYNKYFAKFDELKGVKVLSVHALPGRQIMSTSSVKIEKQDDLAGVKLWSPPGGLTQTAKDLGAVPVNSEFTELQEYVTKGTVDAVFTGPASAKSARILENATSCTKVPGGLGSLSFMVFISQERWDSLTKDERDAILRAADGLPERTGAASDAADEAASALMGDIPTIAIEGEALAKFEDVLHAQVDAWKEKAGAKGLENPDEVFDFYKTALKTALDAGN